MCYGVSRPPGSCPAGGLLNATFGNATELIVSIFALKAGLLRVVQLSLLGSILSNMLLGARPASPAPAPHCAGGPSPPRSRPLATPPHAPVVPTPPPPPTAVLGCAYLFGGTRFKEQTFNKEGVMMNFGLLLLSVMGLSLPAMLHFTHTELHGTSSELALSRFAACILLIIYLAFLYFQLMTHRDLYEEEVRVFLGVFVSSCRQKRQRRAESGCSSPFAAVPSFFSRVVRHPDRHSRSEPRAAAAGRGGR